MFWRISLPLPTTNCPAISSFPTLSSPLSEIVSFPTVTRQHKRSPICQPNCRQFPLDQPLHHPPNVSPPQHALDAVAHINPLGVNHLTEFFI
jgi:hypothetical protein